MFICWCVLVEWDVFYVFCGLFVALVVVVVAFVCVSGVFFDVGEECFSEFFVFDC